MSKQDRIKSILEHVKKIQESKVPIAKYFRENSVPFTRIQYYRYCDILKRSGEEGLTDKREKGNNKKITDEIKDYLIYIVEENPYISSSNLQSKIFNQFGIQLSISRLNSFRASVSLTKLPIPKK